MVVIPHFDDKKIPVDDPFARELIQRGNLAPDGSRLELNILNSPLYGVRLAKLLANLTKPRKNQTPCDVLFEPAKDKELEALIRT